MQHVTLNFRGLNSSVHLAYDSAVNALSALLCVSVFLCLWIRNFLQF